MALPRPIEERISEMERIVADRKKRLKDAQNKLETLKQKKEQEEKAARGALLQEYGEKLIQMAKEGKTGTPEFAKLVRKAEQENLGAGQENPESE